MAVSTLTWLTKNNFVFVFFRLKWIIYAVIAVVCFVLVKAGCEYLQERASAAQ